MYSIVACFFGLFFSAEAITFHHDGRGGWRQGGFNHHKSYVHPPSNPPSYEPDNFNSIETYRVIHEGIGQTYSNLKRTSPRTVKFLHDEVPSYNHLPAHGTINDVQIIKNEPNGKTHFHTIKVIHEIAAPAASNHVHTVSQLHTKVSPSSPIKHNYSQHSLSHNPFYHQFDGGNYFKK